MSRIVRPGGLVLVFAWAFEQPPTSSLYRHALKYLQKDNKQDVLVPWKNKLDGTEHHRYYHLFRQDELESLADGTCLQVVLYGYDKDNWYAVYQRRP
jgi:tRNA (uracil-5-)-methyltransferase TRM9